MTTQLRIPFARLQASSQSSSQASSPVDSDAVSMVPSEDREEGSPGPLKHKRSSKAKPRSSWVYDHMPDEDRETRYVNKKTGNPEWRCKYCPKVYELSGRTTIITKHLTTGDTQDPGHRLKPESARQARARNSQQAINVAIKSSADNPRKRRNLGGPGSRTSLDGGVVEVLWVYVLVVCSLAFRLSSVPEFRSFLTYLNPDIDS